MNTYTKPLALVSSILLSASFAGPVQAATPKEPTTTTNKLVHVSDKLITASSKASLKYAEPKVAVIPAADVPLEPIAAVEVEEVPSATETPAPAVEAGKEAVAPALIEVTSKAAEPKVSASGKGASIAAAAYAQIGISQDCTSLVSNALAAAGINFHGWPADYMTLGPITTAPTPGDLIYYDDAGAGVPHIAVYVGNGMAIHGGWNGGTTALFSTTIGSGPVYIDVA